MITRLSATVLLAASRVFAPDVRPSESPPPSPPAMYEPVADTEQPERFPYRRYHTIDALGRQITFYLSTLSAANAGASAMDPQPRPLVLCVQGSGSQSVFLEVDTPDGTRIASGGPEAAILKQFRDRVRTLVVEKPGVRFLEQPQRPGSAEEGSEEFRREHTLERWTEALNAALIAAVKLPDIDARTILALGHSEGGQVVCHLAAKNPAITHVASLAGGGPTQLFDLLTLARQGTLGAPGDTEEQRIQWVLDGWRRVLDDPDSIDTFFMGHPHRRWSSFLSASPAHALVKSTAKVFLAQGTADTATLPLSTDVLHAELLARGRSVTYQRLDGADHAFMTAGNPEGWLATNRAAVEWFLDGDANTAASPPSH